jgi:hypothetical protein
MKIAALCLAAIAGLAVAAAPAQAVPNRVSFAARLVNNGVPYDGNVTLTFDLFPTGSGGASVWNETAQTAADQGFVAVQLGASTPLDTTVFDGTALYLEITVDGTVLSPRLAIGSVPYAQHAAYADDTGAVPPGAVMFFDLPACPTGWSPLDEARGRAIVGVPTGGTLGGTVGATPLADLEDRAHTHVVDPAAATTSTDGAHTHSVDPGVVNSSFVDLSHTHAINPPSTTTGSSGAHTHAWGDWNNTSLTWRTFNSAGTSQTLVTYANGIASTGSGNLPLEYDNPPAGLTTFYTASAGAHTHTVDIASFASGAASVNMNHAHTVDIPATTSTSAGAHSHTVDVGATTSTAATTGQVMPYLQLLACRRD